MSQLSIRYRRQLHNWFVLDSEQDAQITQKTKENANISFFSYILIILPLILLGGVIYLFHIEENLQLFKIIAPIIICFAIQAWLPLMYRLPLILGITLVTICSLLGIVKGLILIALSSLMITLINLPIRVQWRIYSVLGLSVTLAFINVGSKAQWAKTVIPILGAIFMFRIILYLYEMQYEKQPTSIWKRITYFLLLPNLIFPIFPVIDYKTFKNSYYSKPCPQIYQKGINWMFLALFSEYI